MDLNSGHDLERSKSGSRQSSQALQNDNDDIQTSSKQ